LRSAFILQLINIVITNTSKKMRISTLRNRFLLTVFALLLAYPVFAQRVEMNFPDARGNLGYNLTQQNPAGVRVIHSIPQLALDDVIVNGTPLKMIELSGLYLPNNEGAPDLPGDGRYIALPQGATPSLKINSVRKEIVENIDFLPAPRIPLANEDTPPEYVKDMEIYSKDAFYPAEPFMLSEVTNIRGIDVVMLGITPFQYNPVTKELHIYYDIDVEIVFEGGNGVFGDERLRSRWWDPIQQDAILNRNMIPEIDYTARYKEIASNRSTGYEYVVIVPDDPNFIAWGDSIKLFRTRQGIKTTVVTISEIGGNDHNLIKNYVTNAYQNWDLPPAAILLLADYGTSGNTITSRYFTDHPYGSGSSYISDQWYSDMSNNDMTDIIFARIVAQNLSELQNMVPKFLNYERNPPTNEHFYNEPITAMGWQTERWFQLCTETVNGFWEFELGKQPLRQNNIYSGSPGSVWSTATNTASVVNVFGPNSLDYIPATPAHLNNFGWTANATSINAAINAGAFMVLHRDHGLETGWGEPYYRVQNLSGLSNEDLTFVFTINCLTGKFNWSGTSFAEAFHRHEKGALGLIAPTEISYSFVNDTYVWGMFDNMWPDFLPMYGTTPDSRDIMPSFGNAAGKYFLQQSNWPYNPQHKKITYYLFHHHGDAFSTVYTEMPENLTVDHMNVLLGGLDFFEVTADDGSLIALSVNDELIGVAEGTGSVVSIPIEPQLPGTEMLVTITKQNYYRYESIVECIPPDGCYVVFNENVVNDPDGNNNGIIDYGETIILDVALKNLGTDIAANVTSTISSLSSYVTITSHTNNFGDINPGAIVMLEGAFTFEVSDDIPNNQSLPFEINMFSGDETWTSNFTLFAYAPVLQAGNYFISDPTGNNNGRLDPGETADIMIATINDGQSDALDALANLTLNDPYITVNNATYDLETIAAGQTVYATFNVSVSEDAPIGHAVEFSYDVEAGAYTASKSFLTKIGLILEDFETGDFSMFNWTFGGNLPWGITNIDPFEGDFSAKSGAISHSQNSQMILSYDVGTADSISFYVKVSSENNYDFMRFFINGTQMGQWSGTVGWTRVAYPVTAGQKTFEWRYVKDGSVSAGSDCAWVDYIIFPPMLITTGYAGQDATICEEDTHQLNASATNYNSVVWTTMGDGTFNDATILDPVYTPGPADIATGSANLKLTVTGSTTTIEDELTLTIHRMPEVAAGVDTQVCQDSQFTAAEAAAEHYTELLWESSGTGVFDDPTQLHVTYTPSAGDIAAGSVELTLTALGQSPCGDASHGIMLSIVPQPEAFAGQALSICGDAIAQPEATAANYASLLWTSSGTGTFNDPTILDAIYTPSADDVAAGNVTLTLTAHGQGTCEDAISEVGLAIHALPTAQVVSGEHTICLGETVELSIELTGQAPWEVVDGEGNTHVIEASPFTLELSPQADLTFELVSVSDANDCVNDATGSATIEVEYAPAAPVLPAAPDTVDYAYQTTTVITTQQVENATGYTWNILPAEAGTISADGTQATITWNTDYLGQATIKVCAENDCGDGPWSELTEVELISTVGIPEIAGDWGLAIYPNPSTGQLTLELSPYLSTRANIHVTNLVGKLVYSESVAISGSQYIQTLDLSHLDNGMYILSIESPDLNVYRKLIIRK